MHCIYNSLYWIFVTYVYHEPEFPQWEKLIYNHPYYKRSIYRNKTYLNVQGIILLLIQAINHKHSPIFTRKHYFGCKDNLSVILLKHGANPYGTVCFAREVIRTYRPKCIYTSALSRRQQCSAVQYSINVTHSRSNGAFIAKQNGNYVLKTFCALHLGWVSLMLNFVPSIFGSPTNSPYCFIG